MNKLVEWLGQIAKAHGIPMSSHALLLPCELQINTRDEYHRGVLSCVAQLYVLVSQTPEGRQARLALGFEPFFENGKGPGHGGSND